MHNASRAPSSGILSPTVLLAGCGVLVLLLALYFTPHAHLPPSAPSAPAGSSSAPSDAHMMLVLQWPESLCATQKRGCTPGETVHPYLTLHGLWPLQRHLKHCRADWDEMKLGETLVQSLKEKWPSYFAKSHMHFWKHEYDKHGSCLYPSMESYFDAALQLQQTHTESLLDLLLLPLPASDSDGDSGSAPQALPLSAFRDAIYGRLGVEPMLMCQSNWIPRRMRHPTAVGALALGASARGDEQLLVEVGLCFNAAGELRDCPVQGRIRRCKKGKAVLMPHRHTFTQPHTWEGG